MKITKKMMAFLMAAVMMMAISLTAFAATSVKMYGYMNGSYTVSNHTAAFIQDVVDEGDGLYTITFGPATVYGREGYIGSMTINGETFEADDGMLVVTFEYLPTVEVAEGVFGQPIEYSVVMAGTPHPNSSGALVIE